MTTSTTAPIRTARRWPERPQPECGELGTAAARGTAEATAATETATGPAEATEATRAGTATGRGDAHGSSRHRPIGGRRPEGAHAVTDGERAGGNRLGRADRRR